MENYFDGNLSVCPINFGNVIECTRVNIVLDKTLSRCKF